MKTKILFYIFICSTVIMQSHTPISTQSFVLKNSMLQTIDQAGFFDRAIIDIISARQKIKNSLKGIKHSPERCENQRISCIGRKYSVERCEKQRQSMLGKNKGKKLSIEQKDHLSKIQIGKKLSVPPQEPPTF